MARQSPVVPDPNAWDGIDSVARWILVHERTVLATTVTLLAAWTLYVVMRLLTIHEAGYVGATLMQQLWSPEPGPVLVLAVDPHSPADQAGLRPGDRVVAVNGVGLDQADRMANIVRDTSAGDQVLVTVDRGTAVEDVTVTLASPFDAPGQHLLLAFRFAMGLGVFFGTGLFVLRKRPGDVRALLFFVFSSLLAMTLAGIPLFEVRHFAMPGMVPLLGPRRGVPMVGFAILLACAFLSAPVLLHFALLFPRPAVPQPSLDRLVRWQYLAIPLGGIGLVPTVGMYVAGTGAGRWGLVALTVLLLAATAWIAMRVVREGHATDWGHAVFDRAGRTCALLTTGFSALVVVAFWVARLGGVETAVAGIIVGIGLTLPLGVMLFVVIVVYPFIVCGVLWRAYRQVGPEERQQVKWPVMGIVGANIGALVIATGSVAWALSGRPQTATVSWIVEVTTTGVYALIPVAFAVAILRYRLMDIDVIIRKTLIYGAVSTAVGVVYLVAVAAVSQLVAVRFTRGDTLTVIISTLAAAAAFVPLRTSIQRFIDARFFRSRADTAQALGQLVGELGACHTVADLASRALVGINRTMPTRTAALLAHVPGDPMFRVAASLGLSDTARETARVPATGRLLDQLRLAPTPVDEVPTTVPGRGILELLRARLVVPVREGGEVLGLITLGQKLSDAEFDGDDLEFLTAVAAQAALAWRTVRMRGQERELQEALDIQRGLLPSVVPVVPGFTLAGAWSPARVVSGDYYDAWMVSPSTCVLCIADVSGKGLPAALLMANLQAAVRASARAEAGADAICGAVNRAICAHIRSGRFITFFFCLLDADSGLVRYVNAGHNPPLLVRADGSIERLSTSGIGLGMLATFDYRAGETTIRPGDRLLLFTDGVTEARNPLGDEFGEERLGEIALDRSIEVADDLQRHVMDGVRVFTGGVAEDDVTLLVVVRDVH